jgi:hypothetical protein
MSETKHTPGPWEPCRICGECGVVWGPGHRIVSRPSECSDVQKEESAANARLIAAAPDLLAFAQRMAERDCGYGDSCPGLDSNGRHGPCVGCLARDVIAKARGGR